MKRPPIWLLRLLAFLKIGNAARRLGGIKAAETRMHRANDGADLRGEALLNHIRWRTAQEMKKSVLRVASTSNGVPDHLSGVASVADPSFAVTRGLAAQRATKDGGVA